MAGDILHFAQAFFWNSASLRKSLICYFRSSISCALARAASSTIKIWFALHPVREALRACLRQPISACPAHRFRLQMRRDRKRQPHIHPRAIHRLIRSLPLFSPFRLPAAVSRAASQAAWVHRCVDIPSTAGELDNFIKLPRNLGLPHPTSKIGPFPLGGKLRTNSLLQSFRC